MLEAANACHSWLAGWLRHGGEKKKGQGRVELGVNCTSMVDTAKAHANAYFIGDTCSGGTAHIPLQKNTTEPSEIKNGRPDLIFVTAPLSQRPKNRQNNNGKISDFPSTDAFFTAH